MKTSFRYASPALAILLLRFATASSHAQTSGFNQTAAGTFDYNTSANWVAGNINGLWDSSLTITGNQTITFAADTVLQTGLSFLYDGSFNETLRGTGSNATITLGGDIVVNTVSTTRTINLGSTSANQNLNVDLGGVTRSFTVGSGRTLGFVNVISNGGIVASGGTINFSGANTYSGSTVVNSGTLSLNGATGSSASSDFTINAASSSTTALTFNSGTSGVAGTTRAGSVALRGAGNSNGVLLNVTGNSTANSIDTIANALTASSGFSTVTLTPNSARNVRLEAGSFARSAGATILFRGTDLGVSSLASQAAGDANIHFGAVPLSGNGPVGQSTVGIIKGAFGDITTGGSGSAGGLVTHDSDSGVRLLTATEYTAAIANGQTQTDNVRYARASGDAAQDLNLTAPVTTIQSLSFKITGTGTNSGVTISGDAGSSLKLTSGVIFASQTVTTATASDAMVVSVPTLDLNGQEGVFIAFTAGVSNGNTPAALQINSSIINDGGKGVTIGGTGEVIFGGSTAHEYTGTTTINSGILRLSKSVSNIGIPGDLVMNGGTLLKTANAIPDTANVTLNAGTLWFDNTTSSGNNNHVETINNFTLNGGTLGNHGSNASFTMNGDATLNAGQLGMNQGGDITVLGTTTLNGGLLIAKESSSTTTFTGLTSLNNIAIINRPTAAYTAITLNAHATNKGAQLTLNGDLTFTGNSNNTNPAVIDSSDTALANQGIIALNDVRTFSIGNGAAAVDLKIVPALTDLGFLPGGLKKTGVGTLALSGANTYTGVTIVESGTLLIGGSLNGTISVEVSAGATLGTQGTAAISVGFDGGFLIGGTLAPGGVGEIGTLTALPGFGGKLNFLAGSKLTLDLQPTPAASDLVSFANVDNWLGGSGLATLLLSGAIDYSATYTVFQNTNTPGFTFAGITGYDTAHYQASVSQSGTDYKLSFTSVPEPTSSLLLLNGGMLLGGLRRFRGRKAKNSV